MPPETLRSSASSSSTSSLPRFADVGRAGGAVAAVAFFVVSGLLLLIVTLLRRPVRASLISFEREKVEVDRRSPSIACDRGRRHTPAIDRNDRAAGHPIVGRGEKGDELARGAGRGATRRARTHRQAAPVLGAAVGRTDRHVRRVAALPPCDFARLEKFGSYVTAQRPTGARRAGFIRASRIGEADRGALAANGDERRQGHYHAPSEWPFPTPNGPGPIADAND
jgi:hypothetical protein